MISLTDVKLGLRMLRKYPGLTIAGGLAAPLEGVPIRVFGLLALGATHGQANAEFGTLAQRTAAASSRDPRESPSEGPCLRRPVSWHLALELAVTHVPMLGTGAQDMTRPLCPYPQFAEYKGRGDLKDGSNWSCKAPSAAR
jgi:hypothetical protein